MKRIFEHSGLHSTHRSKGFTLIELLAVVVLAAVIGTTFLFRFSNTYKKLMLERAARELMLTARYARSSAPMHRTTYQLVLDQEQQRFALTSGQDGESVNISEADLVRNPMARPYDLPANVRFETVMIQPSQEDPLYFALSNRIAFRPDGSSDNAIIELSNGRDLYTVQVFAPTAKVVMQEGPAEEAAPMMIDLDLDEDEIY